MMQIQQFRYSADNLGYLVFSENTGIAIDAGAVADMMDFAQKKHITIACITNTHLHHDHISGNDRLLEKTGAVFLDCRDFADNQKIQVGTEALKVLTTPGHTRESVCFAADDFLVTGDTLFNGTVGNCFSGDLEAFYHSLKKLTALAGHTKIFSGHDYVAESLEIAEAIDPDNQDIQQYRRKYDPDLVVSTLKEELLVNPFLRFNAQALIKKLQQRNFPCHTEKQRFISLMEAF
ncbi:MAG: MBL fold metallo-hydrolase [Desulfotignum sp.]|jgi:hydroxyacylglutathione hydrolase|nr:MBL fold metallo-hydrolase [Desulfotignum sp.]